MKKIIVTMMVMVAMLMTVSLFTNSTQAVGRTKIYLSFSDEFPYKDCAWLDTYGYEYDDGRYEMFIEISEFVTITMFANDNDEHGYGYKITEHLLDGVDNEVVSIYGLSLEELDEKEEELLNYIGEYLSEFSERFGEL